MKAAKIISFIAFIISALFLTLFSCAFLYAFLQGKPITPLPISEVCRLFIFPTIFAIGSLLYWLYLRKKEKKGEIVKFSLWLSIILVIISILPVYSGSLTDFYFMAYFGMLSLITFGLPIILFIFLISIIWIFLPSRFYRNLFVRLPSFLLITILILLLLGGLVLFTSGIYGFATLSKCGDLGICEGWAAFSFMAGLVITVISSAFSFLLISKVRKAIKEPNRF